MRPVNASRGQCRGFRCTPKPGVADVLPVREGIPLCWNGYHLLGSFLFKNIVPGEKPGPSFYPLVPTAILRR